MFISEQKPCLTVGRFLVTPITAETTPTSNQNSQSESSTEEQGESESSRSAGSVAPPNKPLDVAQGVAPCWSEGAASSGSKEPDDEQETEEEEKVGEEGGGEEGREGGTRQRRISVSLLDGKVIGNVSQPWISYTRSTSYASSDETESDNEDMWEELQELRER